MTANTSYTPTVILVVVTAVVVVVVVVVVGVVVVVVVVVVVKRLGRGGDYSPALSAKVNNYGAIPPLPIQLNGMVLN
jgi:hypothetical protein